MFLNNSHLMKKYIGILFYVIIFFKSQVVAQQSAKPNVLFIAVDDLKPILGCYGDKIIKTPNIDRLAKMGTVFLNNYCQQAVCGPTRASLMTGLRPDDTKVWDLKTKMRDVNPNIISLPQYFISQGYATSGIGKIYHAACVDDFDKPSWSIPYLIGDSNYIGKDLGEALPDVLHYYENPVTKNLISKYKLEASQKGLKGKAAFDYVLKYIKPATECIDIADEGYEDGANAIIAKAQLISLSKTANPFFLAVGFHKPHMPFVAPKKYWDLYNRADMPLAKFQQHALNSPDIAYHTSAELRNYTDIPPITSFTDEVNNIGLNPDKQRELIHGYYACVSYIDAQVGILLNALDSLGTLNNTIIVLWGDHGWHLGDHDLWNKHTNFEQATRSPLIISAPGMKPGKTASISEHVDIFPSICALAKLPIPSNLAGKSLQPVMASKTAIVKDFALSQYPRSLKLKEAKALGYVDGKMMGYSIRTSRYRYVIWMSNFTSKDIFDSKKVYATELYDYLKDPLEKVNVVSEKSYASIASDMNKKMLSFFASQAKK